MEIVDFFADEKWEVVGACSNFADVKIEFVDFFADLKVEIVQPTASASLQSEFGTNNFGNGPLGGRCRFGNIPRT